MTSTTIELEQIEQPEDARLLQVYELMAQALGDPNVVLGLDRLQEFLAANPSNAERHFCVLAALEGEAVVGATVFSHVRATNCGFSEAIVVASSARGTRLGRRLFDGRKALLDAEARRTGQPRCNGLFIEVENPDRTPAKLLPAEQESAMDGWDRLRIFEHLGFWRVDLPYVQPPLATGKASVDYLDLLFALWTTPARQIPAAWVLDTVRPIWASWAPDAYRSPYAALAGRLGNQAVKLRPIFA